MKNCFLKFFISSERNLLYTNVSVDVSCKRKQEIELDFFFLHCVEILLFFCVLKFLCGMLIWTWLSVFISTYESTYQDLYIFTLIIGCKRK